MTTLTPRRIRTLAVLAGATPLLALVAVRVLDPFGAPSPASAGVIENPEPDAQAVRRTPKPTEREREAARHILLMASEPPSPTPFYYPPGSLREDAPEMVETPEAALPAPSFQVSAILAGAGSPIAVINGKALRVGQTIENGWSLAEVHEPERAVVIAHEDGRTLRISIRR
jgi:hypothetical protein